MKEEERNIKGKTRKIEKRRGKQKKEEQTKKELERGIMCLCVCFSPGREDATW